MPPYLAIHWENLVFMLGVGLALVLVIGLARSSRVLTLPSVARAEPPHAFGGEVEEENRPVPWLIVLACVAYFGWAIGYVLFCGSKGL